MSVPTTVFESFEEQVCDSTEPVFLLVFGVVSVSLVAGVAFLAPFVSLSSDFEHFSTVSLTESLCYAVCNDV